MSLVLYRKYRPKNFSEVIGQNHVIQTITNAISQNMIGHGYLFFGPHGCGKTTLARLLAKAVNCQNRQSGQFEPCNKCESCLAINEGRAIDLIEIDAASNRGIEEIRELKEGIRFQPTSSKYKVFIIDECHQLSKDAANALLKTLEEPPAHAIFVLATTEIHKMIPTIKSRCQDFNFRRLRLSEISERLKQILKNEKISFDDEAIDLIALSASGSVRDAETLLDEVVSFSGQGEGVKAETVRALLGSADKESIFEFLELISQKKLKESIDFVNKIIFAGVDLKEFIKAVIDYLREVLLLQINPDSQSDLFLSLTNSQKNKILKIVEVLSQAELKSIIEILSAAENKMKFASIIQLPLELALIDICQKNSKI